jgi:cellulose synthase (UDP-forming)
MTKSSTVKLKGLNGHSFNLLCASDSQNGWVNMNFKILRNKFLIIGTIISSVIYLIWRIFFTIPFGYGALAVGCGIYLLIVEIIGFFESAIHYYSMSNIQYPKRPEVDEALFPHVDIFVATYNEPVDLLYKTINGCINMDYPDKSKIHIYICDDSDREEMKELARQMNVNHLGRKNGKDAKAGNLNNALLNSNSPLVVTFDADMIPMHDFLTACVPYFCTKEKVGFVQTPQSFYNPDLFQYNLFSD